MYESVVPPSSRDELPPLQQAETSTLPALFGAGTDDWPHRSRHDEEPHIQQLPPPPPPPAEQHRRWEEEPDEQHPEPDAAVHQEEEDDLVDIAEQEQEEEEEEHEEQDQPQQRQGLEVTPQSSAVVAGTALPEASVAADAAATAGLRESDHSGVAQAVAHGAMLVMCVQYCLNAMTWALITSRPSQEERTPRPERLEGRKDTSISIAFVMAGLGLFLVLVRLALLVAVGISAMDGFNNVDSPFLLPRFLEIARSVSYQLRFSSVVGATLYFIEAMYLQYAWNHPDKDALAILVMFCGGLEVGVSLPFLRPDPTRDLRSASARHARATPAVTLGRQAEEDKPEGPRVRELLCHSCLPPGSADPTSSWVVVLQHSGIECKGCDKAEEMQLQGMPAFAAPPDGDLHCSICLSPVEDGDLIGVLPCRHIFHKTCIEMWLERAQKCPMRCSHEGSQRVSTNTNDTTQAGPDLEDGRLSSEQLQHQGQAGVNGHYALMTLHV